jgi:hypothetical protein
MISISISLNWAESHCISLFFHSQIVKEWGIAEFWWNFDRNFVKLYLFVY